MAAALPPAIVRRIYELRKKGWRIDAIAKEVGAGRASVARYARLADKEIELGGAPAADLTEFEVQMLKELLHAYVVGRNDHRQLELFAEPSSALNEGEVSTARRLHVLVGRAEKRGAAIDLTGEHLQVLNRGEVRKVRGLLKHWRTLMRLGRDNEMLECLRCKTGFTQKKARLARGCPSCGCAVDFSAARVAKKGMVPSWWRLTKRR